MKKLLILGIIFSLVIQSGCGVKNNNVVEVTAPLAESKHTNIELYIKDQVVPGPYEPESGIYLGAYTEGNTDLIDTMNTYESLFNTDQTFRVFQFTETHPVTDQDLLRCIADKKTPYIKLLMTNDFDMTSVYQLVGSLRSKYKTPIFIELFPVTEKTTNATQYKVYYQEAYEIIKKYLPQAVIVWGIDLEKSHESELYYPGDHVVDWVGLNVYLPRFKEGELYEPNITNRVDMWYKNFQQHKPLLISGLAISHFSRYDHTYTVENTKSKLELFYKDFPAQYPRIKGIIYVDIDMAQVTPGGVEDYRISNQPQLVDYMSTVWRDDKFLHKLDVSKQTFDSLYIKYTVPALEYNNHTYISLEYAKTLLKLDKINNSYLVEDDKGEQYYEIKQLLKDVQAYYTK